MNEIDRHWLVHDDEQLQDVLRDLSVAGDIAEAGEELTESASGEEAAAAVE